MSESRSAQSNQELQSVISRYVKLCALGGSRNKKVMDKNIVKDRQKYLRVIEEQMRRNNILPNSYHDIGTGYPNSTHPTAIALKSKVVNSTIKSNFNSTPNSNLNIVQTNNSISNPL